VVVRQARLRREYAAWYPTLPVLTWVPAPTVARAVARQLLEGEPHWAQAPRWEPGPRILDDRHFEFRGGAEARGPELRTRRGDPLDAENPHGPDALTAEGRTVHEGLGESGVPRDQQQL